MKDIYPTITIVSKIADDGAEYFGPYGSRGVTHSLLEAIRLTLKLPGCSKVFPRDVGKDRPCLNYHMNQCEGWCQESVSAVTYRERMEQARQRSRATTSLWRRRSRPICLPPQAIWNSR